MKYHSVYLIFNLLYLKYQIEGNSSTQIDDLREAFYEYQLLINKHNNLNIEFDFDEELEDILYYFSDIFEIDDDEISFKDGDPTLLFEIIPDYLEDEPTELDTHLDDFVSNEIVYFALNIKPPLEEMESIFKTNMAVFPLYELIAKLEFEHRDTKAARTLIKFHKNNLKEFFMNANNADRDKIRVCLAHYNYSFLSDYNEEKPNINDSWYVALLSDEEKTKVTLAYDKISYYNTEFDEEDEESELTSSEVMDSENESDILPYSEIPMDSCYICDDRVFFLSRFVIFLNSYINTLEDSEVKRILIEHKFLLLTLGELGEMEDYYLKHGTLDTLCLPPFRKEWLNENSFEFLIGSFEELIKNIRISNTNMTNHKTKRAIISLCLLKCFLDLSINETIKNELNAEITNPEYYKNPKYSIITSLIDDIIYSSKGIERHRK